jgi:ribosomal protein S18 acetylase RimI-like enzyme
MIDQSKHSELIIREASIPDEIPLIRVLFREYSAEQEVDLCFQGFEEELATLPGKYARPRGGIWLAEAADEIAGCVAMRPIDSERAELKRLFVRAAFRGSGLGRQLTVWVLDQAGTLGYRRLVLDTLPTMTSAIALYRSLGFTETEPYYANPVCGALFLSREVPSAKAHEIESP